jgi:hypothetical protein
MLEICAYFCLIWVNAQSDDACGRVLLGDNTGGGMAVKILVCWSLDFSETSL